MNAAEHSKLADFFVLQAAQLVERTRALKVQVEGVLAGMFGRRVNIMGEINTVLAATV